MTYDVQLLFEIPRHSLLRLHTHFGILDPLLSTISGVFKDTYHTLPCSFSSA